MAENILTFPKCLKLIIPIILIFNQISNSSGDVTYEGNFCSPLTSTASTNFKCRYNGIQVENCENPRDGTTVLISCKRFYEEATLKDNPIRLCRNGRWSPDIPECYSSPIYGADPTEARFKPNLDLGDQNKPQATCRSLSSNLSTNVTCVYNGIPLKNCQNPTDGTMVVISCNPFHEKDSFEETPIPVCRNGRWSSSIPQCYSSYGESNLLVGSQSEFHRISCPSLSATASTNFECKHNAKPIENCLSPVDQTTVLISCNPSFEEPSLALNPIRSCQNGKWSSDIPLCRPSNRAGSSPAYDPLPRDQTRYHRICRSLTSTTSTNIKCEYNGSPLRNCENPIDGTTVLISCNSSHKELSLGNNPNRILCKDGKWSSSIPQCIPVYDIASSTTSEKSYPLPADRGEHHNGCPSLTSSTSTNIKCINNGQLLNNCQNPTNGTIVVIACNLSYEEFNLKNNPIRICRDGKWSSSIPQCHSNCGKVPSEMLRKSNSSLGSKNYAHDHPWHVGIYNTTRKEYICGGSIIHPKIILTAAHCIADDTGNHKPAENLLVAAGKYYRNYNDIRDKYAQYSMVSQIHTPIGYEGRKSYHAFDIAILVMDEPFTLSIAVQPVCLSLNEESEDLKFFLNNTGIVAGWGSIKRRGPHSDVLKQIIIPYVPFRKCYQEVPETFRRYITNDKICGGYINNGSNICTGDGGGGFIFKNVAEDRYYIKGILSVGLFNDLHECYLNQYSAYTSILYNIEFMKVMIDALIKFNIIEKFL